MLAGQYTAHAAFESLTECEKRRSAIVTSAGLVDVASTCLPETTDPRGPKEKGDELSYRRANLARLLG